jgi:predicted ATPase
MLKTIYVNGFKSLRDFELELGDVNVLIGANGSGKSNILEAIGVLSAAAGGRIDDESLMRRGVRPGLPGLYKSSFQRDRTPPHISLSAHSSEASYDVSLLNPLKDPKPAWKFKTENFNRGAQIIVRRGVRQKKNYDPFHGLAALKAVDLDKQDPAGLLLKTLQAYAIYTPNTTTLRGVGPDPQTREPVGLGGGRLATALNELQMLADENEHMEMALEDILSCMDWVERFDTSTGANELLSPSVPRPKRIVRFTDRYMVKDRNTLTAFDASEGVLYMLFAAVLALSPSAPAFLAIDNLDHALNPRLVRRLSSLLCKWVLDTDRKQMIFTAHNPAVIDGLDLQNDRIRLFVVDRDNLGHSRAKRVTMSAELKRLAEEKDWPLSRLWMMGHIGGMPNV